MSTQIDPLTGLPMVFDSIVQQIPLGVQTTPWADLEATARPTTPELYPDNHFTVGAFLSAQNQDDKSAQTVMTNGDHDLRVHVTNAASGVGGFVATNWQAYAWQEEVRCPGDFADSFEIGFYDQTWYLAEANLSVMCNLSNSPPPAGTCTVNVEFHQTVGATMYFLSCCLTYDSVGLKLGELSTSAHFSPSTPLQMPVFISHPHSYVGVQFDTDFCFMYTLNMSFCQKQ